MISVISKHEELFELFDFYPNLVYTIWDETDVQDVVSL